MNEIQHNSATSALVLSVSRRNARVLCNGESMNAYLAERIEGIAVGDRVQIGSSKNRLTITARMKRKNSLARTYRAKNKDIAANIDLLCIVTATPPLFNTVFIDRVLTVANIAGIPAALVINKEDLFDNTRVPFLKAKETSTIREETLQSNRIYAQLNLPVVFTSTRKVNGLESLSKLLFQQNLQSAALVGVSGVGKSSILNAFIPGVERRISDVSRKTGQGRQTTNLAVGYLLDRKQLPPLLLIDLPGIQSFGVSTLTERQVKEAFPEFVELQHECEYLDCQHTAEPNCAIKEGVKEGKIAPSRYQSYLGMLAEIEEARPY